jgi:hypothetical protein
MTDDECTPWEKMELLNEHEEEPRRARGLPNPSDAEWDHGGRSQVVNPNSAPYPPPYDPGSSNKPDADTT